MTCRYRNLHGDVNGGAGGFGDLIIGTKSMLLLDSELLQFTFQFATQIPTGVPSRGTGVGHVTLDPSLLWAVKLYPDTYWQGQLGYTIPISGTQDGATFAGSVLHYHLAAQPHSLPPGRGHRTVGLHREAVGYTFTSGRFTDAVHRDVGRGEQPDVLQHGAGRCGCASATKLDFGFGMQFALTSNHFADQLYRTEVRFRF